MAGVGAAILDYEVAWGTEVSQSRVAKGKKPASLKPGSMFPYPHTPGFLHGE